MNTKFYPLAALALGFISAFSMPPMHLWVLLFIGLNGLYWLFSQPISKRIGFFIGYAFGFGYFVTSLYWIGNALLVDGNEYKWAYPLGVFGFQGMLAFFYAFAGLAIVMIGHSKRWVGYIAFTLVFTVIEFIRGHIFTGFPWNLFAYTWADSLPVIQILPVLNAYALTGMTILWFTAPMFLKLTPLPTRIKWLIGGAILASFIGNYVYGLNQLHAPLHSEKDVAFKIVQPNIDQSEKWESSLAAAHFQKHIDLSEAKADNTAQTTYIVWPETAVSSWVLDTDEAYRALREMLSSYPNDVYLITGTLIYDPALKTYANSILILDKTAAPIARYDKHHLVPFGEFMPLQRYIPFGPVSQFQGFERGAGVQTFPVGDLSLLPLICYEIIFPGKTSGIKADAIINVTNDAWYGKSAGPYQHLAIAQYRAIETRTPVIRSANTGFSAMIDPHGRIIGRTDLYKDAVVNVGF